MATLRYILRAPLQFTRAQWPGWLKGLHGGLLGLAVVLLAGAAWCWWVYLGYALTEPDARPPFMPGGTGTFLGMLFLPLLAGASLLVVRNLPRLFQARLVLDDRHAQLHLPGRATVRLVLTDYPRLHLVARKPQQAGSLRSYGNQGIGQVALLRAPFARGAFAKRVPVFATEDATLELHHRPIGDASPVVVRFRLHHPRDYNLLMTLVQLWQQRGLQVEVNSGAE